MSTSSEKSPSGDGKRRPRKKSPGNEPESPPELENQLDQQEHTPPAKGKGRKKSDPEAGKAKGMPKPKTKEVPPQPPIGTKAKAGNVGLWSWFSGLLLLGAGLGGLWWLNRELLKDWKILGSGKIPFTTIQCPTPEAMGKDAFLEEVRYIGREDKELNLLEPTLPARLAAAFRSHPWVAEVERVEISPGTTFRGNPTPGSIQIQLRFRTPVLRVPLESEGLANEPGEREVDALGILLPNRLDTSGVPELATRRKGVPPNPGSTWNDTVVQGGARLGGELKQAGLLKRIKRIRSVGSGWELETAKGPVFWGRTPGYESPGEPVVSEKCRRLGQWLSAPVDSPPPDLAKAN